MKYSSEFINDLKQQVNSIELIGEDTLLKKHGNIYKGRCPFPDRHQGDDSDPSFVVYPRGTKGDYDNFYCFGCEAGDKKNSGYGSDVFEYIRLKDNVMFDESIRLVAKRLNIEPVESQESNERDNLYRYTLFQNRSYYKELQGSKVGLDYVKSRGISNQSILDWRLGMVPQDSKFPPTSNRLAIPIFDASGRVCGFGYRKILETDNGSKYLNSPESPIFSKKDIWYGLYQARQEIMNLNEVIIVEGYMDVILLSQFGVKNVVASMGTAINNLDSLRRYTDTVIIWTDSDKAGVQAIEKYTKALASKGFYVKVMDMEINGKDPGDIALEYKENTRDYVKDNAVYEAQYRLNKCLMKLDSQIMNAKLTALPTIVKILKTTNNPQELDLYIRWVSNHLDIPTESIKDRIFD